MKRVIIIGASSGIGRSLAIYYAKKGCVVGACARRLNLLYELQSIYPDNIKVCRGDLCHSMARDVLRELISDIGGVDLIIYSAGVGRMGRNYNFDTEKSITDISVDGFVGVVAYSYSYFKERQRNAWLCKPQIVVISSISALRGLGSSPSYSASKRYQLTYLEAMTQLSVADGVDISFTAILPGFVQTDFIGDKKYPMIMSLEYATKKIVTAIERRKRCEVVDVRWKVVAFLMKLVPSILWSKMKI